MKRSTRMLLMNSGKSGQREHGREREGYGDMRYPYTSYIPPVYEYDGRWNRDRQETHEKPMNRIGFSVEGEMERMPREHTQEYRHSASRQRTGGSGTAYHENYDGKGPLPFTREAAMEWTGDMENGDGSKGPHWSMEQVRQVMEQRGIDCDPLQFFAVLNSVYSDYCAVAKKHGVGNKMDFYADLAKAWLEDPDAVEDKAARYFEYIVKH